jgi:acetoin utilization protein AcuC
VGAPVDPGTPVPERWRELVLARTGRDAPSAMTDGASPLLRPWNGDVDLSDDADQMLVAVRAGCFPQHGLVP